MHITTSLATGGLYVNTPYSSRLRLTQTSGEGKNTIFSRTRRKSTLPIKSHYRCSKADLPSKIKASQWLRSDRRPALRSVLHSLLVTYSSLLASLLAPPPISEDTPPEWRRHVEWITVLSQNLMAAANDLRPVQAWFFEILWKPWPDFCQARGNLESMMRRQLELRRQETKNLHQ